MAVRVSKILVSACLAGINCSYRGKNSLMKPIKRLVDEGEAIPVCPEVLGGLPTPRENAEIVYGNGQDVLNKRAKVITASGKDVSKNFVTGAKKILRLVRRYKIKKAILKSNSPSCGVGQIYDGTFRHILKNGDGVLASLLKLNGIKVGAP